MDKTIKGLKPLSDDLKIDGSNYRILIVHTRWNSTVVDPLVKGAKETLINEYNVKEENVCIYGIPGAYELPYTAHHLIEAAKREVNIDTDTPVIFGVLTCLNEEQALLRAGIGENSHNHAIDWAGTAIEMAKVRSIKEF
ncbi:Lumazine synthase [Piromyces finnis]|uniref:6,7-dimethyl-8-ribityllumazine synthase n=1 Tax=Piromyces finnis TaxID=1754191 RepID=A0A1Y1UHP4_9FUNG|nr:Lumazine synthase [Piromyces finnis]|eukprot:ORX37509.1 Lumazine synthase [Piromyces finnis]